MEEKYQKWLQRRREEVGGHLLVDAVHSVGDYLDKNGYAEVAVRFVLQLKHGRLSIERRVQAALAISVFSERGAEFRFEWNKYYRGEEWALKMEASEKRLFNPV